MMDDKFVIGSKDYVIMDHNLFSVWFLDMNVTYGTLQIFNRTVYFIL